jgi:hypothetical protein
LSGEHPDVQTALESFSEHRPSFFEITLSLLEAVLPIIERVPTLNKSLTRKLNAAMEVVAIKFLGDSEEHKAQEKSIIKLLRSS